ncbi:MAG: hypothetical protein ABI837_00055 [Acidobacteriota bacterium]
MGLLLPAALFFLLDLHSPTQFFTLSAALFTAWGVADVVAAILEKPRLDGRSARQAIREDWERRQRE